MVGKEYVRAMGAVLTDDSAAVPACGRVVGRFRALSAGHCVWRAWSNRRFRTRHLGIIGRRYRTMGDSVVLDKERGGGA